MSFHGNQYSINGTWTPERTRICTELWNEGKSAKIIAGILGLKTRNQVIGKIARLRLQRRPTTTSAPHRGYTRVRSARLIPIPKLRSRIPKPTKPKVIEIPIVYDPSHELPLLDANPDQCRWIDGEPLLGSTTFVCGAPVAGEASWCPYHSSLVYAKARGKERPLKNKPKPTGITLRASVGLRL